ncbi:MAG: hypothetical protein JWO05_1784 [Gemmatimonadetes bacterium]|nr:hypothetical protein [Gemmatimonadota bacterium]
MADETPDETPAAAPAATPAPAPRRKRWLWKVLAILVLVPGIVFALWGWVALSYSYSQGERAGYVQKFSKKGWLCKTWEGELSMANLAGAPQERWTFTVRNDSVAALVTRSMGDKVALVYEQHRGVPSVCFGETEYFVTGVRSVQP